MQTAVPLACFLSMIRPPGVQYENALLQIAPVDKSKCPYIKDSNDIGFQLFTRHNPTAYQELILGDDEKLFASNIDYTDKTVIYFHAWMEQPDDGSGIMVREAYMQRGDTNVIMVDAHHLEAGPWYFTAAQNTWYIGRFAALFIDYLVSRGLNLNNTHLIGHSLGAHAAGVAGSALKSGRVARITGLDPALPLFDNLPLEQRLDATDAHFVDIIHTDAGIFGCVVRITGLDPALPLFDNVPLEQRLDATDAHFVDIIHTDAGIFGYKAPMGHADFYPNGGISPQPGCELEVVLPKQLLLNKCDSRTQTRGFYSFYLTANRDSHLKRKTLESKLENLFAYIQSVKARNGTNKDTEKAIDKSEDKLFSVRNDTNVKEIHETIEIPKEIDPVANKTDEIINGSIKDIISHDDADKSEDYVEDQVAEASEYDVTRAEFNQEELKDKETLTLIKESEEFVLNDGKIDRNDNSNDSKSGNNENVKENKDFLREIKVNETQNKEIVKETSSNEEINITDRKETSRFTLFDTETEISEDITTTEALSDKNANKRSSKIITLNYKDPCEPKIADNKKNTKTNDEVTEILPTETNPKRKEKAKPKINILNILGTTFRISSVISTLKQKKNKLFTDKLTKFLSRNNIESTTSANFFENLYKKDKPKNHVVKRQKRFLSLFKRSEEAESNSILFKMLDFLIKNRKNVLPVFTVMREINTLVKSGNGELNHFSKEQNNYIGATPPVFTPITYNLELGNENRAVAFIKRLLGMSPKGDRLTISGRK